MEKITLHRALSELKLIDAKIEKQTAEINPVGVFQKGKLINGLIQEEEFKRHAEGKYNSVIDLIERKAKIKSAIVRANSETPIQVAGKEMTIADAITRKASIIQRKALLDILVKRNLAAQANMNKQNEVVNQNVQRILEATFGKENVKAGKDDLDNVRKPYLDSNEFHFFDPIHVNAKIESLEKEIGDFEAEVDAVLSEINAVTYIEF